MLLKTRGSLHHGTPCTITALAQFSHLKAPGFGHHHHHHHEFHRDASLEQNFRAAGRHIPSTTSLELKNIWKWACEFSKSQV